MPLKIQQHSDGVSFSCRVTPKAHKNSFKEIRDGVLFVGVACAPVEGQANKALIDLISSNFKIPKSQIEIIHGLKGRNKTIKISGVNVEYIKARLEI